MHVGFLTEHRPGCSTRKTVSNRYITRMNRAKSQQILRDPKRQQGSIATPTIEFTSGPVPSLSR